MYAFIYNIWFIYNDKWEKKTRKLQGTLILTTCEQMSPILNFLQIKSECMWKDWVMNVWLPAVKLSDGSVMVWECFEEGRTGGLIQVKEILQKEEYYSILQRYPIPSSLCTIWKSLFNKTIQNAILHYQESKYKKFKKEKGQNFDLSPIELVTDELGLRIQGENSKSKSGLFSAWRMVGKVCHLRFFQKLLERISRICKAVTLRQVVVLLTKIKYDAFIGFTGGIEIFT